jgi:hypothetical protein
VGEGGCFGPRSKGVRGCGAGVQGTPSIILRNHAQEIDAHLRVAPRSPREYAAPVTWEGTSREGAGQLPALLLDQGQLPSQPLTARSARTPSEEAAEEGERRDAEGHDATSPQLTCARRISLLGQSSP